MSYKPGARRGLFRSGHHDENHAALVALLSRLGPEPIDTTKVGAGFPDVCWPFQGLTILVEFKTPDGLLTPPQERFRREWVGGPLWTVSSEAEILAAIDALSKRREIRSAIRG